MKERLDPEPLAGTEEVEKHQVIDILDVLLVLTRRRLFLGAVIGGVFALSMLTGFLLPRYYEARISLLPPQSNSTMTNLMAGQIAAAGGFSTRELGMKNPTDLYVGLLSSQSVADELIERFHLREVYGERRLADTRRKLSRFSNITAGKEGLITVTVEDVTPQRAADIANGYAEALQNLNERLAFTEAGQRRLFFERELSRAKSDLEAAEAELSHVQKRTGIIEPAANAKTLLEGIGLVRAQLAAKEVEVRSMRAFETASNPDLKMTEQQVIALRAQLEKLESGVGEGAAGSTAKLSGGGLEYASKLREVKYREALFENLSRQFEMARLEEAKEGGPVQVVDRATPPERHSRPRRMLIAGASTLIAGFVAFVAILLEGSARNAMNEPLRSGKLMELWESWRTIRRPL